MMTTPSTMGPLEAYEALMLFARRRGEGALRLAMHAAVPQSFRPDLLHLLKLNFLPRELHDPAAEADVLFSQLCEEVGPGYFEFGPHVRTLLLDNLAANYASDRTPRIERVANFLLFYVEHMERRAAGGLDRLWRDYLEVQRWVALAFLDADDAARQLAAALKGGASTGEFAARLRLGGLATALSSPLVRYRHVLNYAAGLQALEAGDHERARTLLSGLGDEEIEVGGIRLRPATELLRDYSAHAPTTVEAKPAPEPSDTSPTGSVPDYLLVTCAVSKQYSSLFMDVSRELLRLKLRLRMLPILSTVQEATRFLAIDDVLLIFGTDTSFDTEYVRELIDHAHTLDKPVLFLKLPGAELPFQWARDWVKTIECPTLEEVQPRLLGELGSIKAQKGPREKAGETEAEKEEADRIRAAFLNDLRALTDAGEKARALAALAGSDDPRALETLAEAVWGEEDARVRLAAVNALSKSRSERALEALLIAAGDEDSVVRRVAAEALMTAPINPVLIFGFFGTDRVESREVIREELRRRGYDPLVFPYTRPPIRSTADIARSVTHLVSFAIADLTAPREIEEELVGLLDGFLSKSGAPVVLLSQRLSLSKLPLRLEEKYPSRVFRQQPYGSPGALRESFDRLVIEPVNEKLRASGKEATPPVEEQSPASDAATPPDIRYHIYFSYSSADMRPSEATSNWLPRFMEDLPRAVEQRLGAPVSTFIDRRNIEVGDRWREVIDDTLRQSAVLLCILSPNYFRSQFCRRELETFRRNAERTTGLSPHGRTRIFASTTDARLLTQIPDDLLNHVKPHTLKLTSGRQGPRGSYQEDIARLAADIALTLQALGLAPAARGEAEDFDALYERASKLESDGQLEQALAAYTRAAGAAGQNNRSQHAAHLKRGEVLARLGRFEEALEAYDDAIRIVPDDAHSHWRRSLTLERSGRFEEAVTSYRSTANFATEYPLVRAARIREGSSLVRLRRFDEAIKVLFECLKLSEGRGDRSDLAETLNYIGVVFTKMGRVEEALKHLEQSLSIYQQLGDRQRAAFTLNDLGQLMRLTGNTERAIAFFRESGQIFQELEDNSGAATVLINLGGALTDAGNYSEAEAVLTGALEILSKAGDRSGEAAAFIALGALYSKGGRLEQALDAYNKALELSPDNPDATAGRDEVMKKMSA